MAGAPPRSTSNFFLDDKDLYDADLWAVIDSAAASRKPLLSLTNFASPLPPLNPRKTPRLSEGEVVQDEHWRSFPRPQKMARFAEMSPDGNSGAVVRHQSPRVSFPSPCASPEKGGMAVGEMSPVFETSPVVFGGGEREIGRHSLAGPLPSVSLFRQYQSAAMAILDKSDYTVISGNPLHACSICSLCLHAVVGFVMDGVHVKGVRKGFRNQIMTSRAQLKPELRIKHAKTSLASEHVDLAQAMTCVSCIIQ